MEAYGGSDGSTGVGVNGITGFASPNASGNMQLGVECTLANGTAVTVATVTGVAILIDGASVGAPPQTVEMIGGPGPCTP